MIIIAIYGNIIYKNKINKVLFCLPIIISIFTVFSYLAFAYEAFSWVKFSFDMSKILVLVLLPSVVAPLWFNYNDVYNNLIIMAIIMTIYISIQTLAFRIGISIPNLFRIGFIQPYVEGYTGVIVQSNLNMLRPAGMLTEPAFYSNYMGLIIPMYIEQNRTKMNVKKWCLIMFFVLGVIMSTSTTGIIFVGIILTFYILQAKNKTKILFLYLFLVLLLLIMLNNNIFNQLYNENAILSYTENKLSNINYSGRVGRSYEVLNTLKGTSKLFGVGWGNANTYLINQGYIENSMYLNALTALIMNTGYVGCGLFLLLLLSLIIKSIKYKDSLSFILLIQYTIRGSVSGMFFNTYGVLYLTIVFFKLYIEKRKIVQEVI